MAQKILVCDDSRTIQQAVAVALFEMKTEIVTVSDPAQVVSSALAESPKLILLDNRMNREGRDDGYALCQQIKNHDDLKHIPVIFLAGRSYEPQKGRDAGAFDFIEKPFETQMLADKVQAGLSASPGEVVRPKMPTSSGPSDFRATTALPTFSPVDLQNMLPPDASARLAPPPLANVADLAPPPLSFADNDEDLSPPPPPSLSFADDAEEDLSPPIAPPSFHFGDNKEEVLAPPPALSFADEEDALPPPPPFGFEKPTPPAPPPLSFHKPSPPPLSFNNPADDDDLSPDEVPAPPPFGFAKTPAPPSESRALKQTPVIPAPTDSPKEFPVRELFRPAEEPPRPPAFDSEPENTIVAMPAPKAPPAAAF
ncbi:response regulator, partial [Myxococcota bacterium]|nr:response regulator [Myxococcota bacterium]